MPTEVFVTPWPLSEDYCLCVYDPAGRNFDIYLVDSFGDRELIRRDPSISCLEPDFHFFFFGAEVLPDTTGAALPVFSGLISTCVADMV